MIILLIISLPFLAYSLATFNGKDLLISYIPIVLLIFNLLMCKKDLKIYFPIEAKHFMFFLIYLFVNLAYTHFAGKGISQLLMLFIYFLSYVLLINILIYQKIKTIKHFVDILILVSVAASLYSFLQAAFPYDTWIQNGLRNANNAFAIWDPIFQQNNGSFPYGLWGLMRVTGLAAEPSNWAAFLTIPLCILLPRLFFQFRIFDLFCSLTIFAVILLTHGRTGWLSLALAVLFFPSFILKGNRRKLFMRFAIAMTCIIVTLSLFTEFTDLYTGRSKWSRIERMAGMTNAMNMFISSPVIGVGYGKFLAYAESLQPSLGEGGTRGTYAFNYYLRLLAETGIVGLCIWLIFLRSMWERYFAIYSLAQRNKKFMIMFAGLGLAYYSILISWINIDGINFMYVWFIFALMSSMSSIIENNG